MPPGGSQLESLWTLLTKADQRQTCAMALVRHLLDPQSHSEAGDFLNLP